MRRGSVRKPGRRVGEGDERRGRRPRPATALPHRGAQHRQQDRLALHPTRAGRPYPQGVPAPSYDRACKPHDEHHCRPDRPAPSRPVFKASFLAPRHRRTSRGRSASSSRSSSSLHRPRSRSWAADHAALRRGNYVSAPSSCSRRRRPIDVIYLGARKLRDPGQVPDPRDDPPRRVPDRTPCCTRSTSPSRTTRPAICSRRARTLPRSSRTRWRRRRGWRPVLACLRAHDKGGSLVESSQEETTGKAYVGTPKVRAARPRGRHDQGGRDHRREGLHAGPGRGPVLDQGLPRADPRRGV